jgi:hypothetical protein
MAIFTIKDLRESLQSLSDWARGLSAVKPSVRAIELENLLSDLNAAADGATSSLGAKAEAAVVDPTTEASLVALVKGLLKQLQGSGTGAATVSVGEPIPPEAGWSATQDSAAATSQTLTKAAEVGKRHYITGVSCAISGADNATNDLTVVLKDGATAIWKGVIGSAEKRGAITGQTFPVPIRCGDNTAVSVEVSAGAAGVVTTANLVGFTL